MATEVQLELLVGRVLDDANGKRVGRIEDVRAELHDGELLVKEFVVGTRGLLERMALSFSSMFVGIESEALAVPWDRMDLTDVRHPRLNCAVEELKDDGA